MHTENFTCDIAISTRFWREVFENQKFRFEKDKIASELPPNFVYMSKQIFASLILLEQNSFGACEKNCILLIDPFRNQTDPLLVNQLISLQRHAINIQFSRNK